MTAPPQPKTRKTALVAATRVELEPTVKALSLRWRGDVAVGSFAGKPMHALLTGMGRSRAKSKVANLLKQERFERVIHLGFAGGLVPDLEAGQMLHIQRIVGDDGQTIAAEHIQHPPDEDEAEHILLTAEQLAYSVKAKAALHDKHQAHAVDMESLHVARLALDADLDYLPLRIICDPADLALPRESVRWVHSDGSTHHRAVVGHLIRRPRNLGMIRTLGRNARHAADRLAEQVQPMLEGD